MSDKLFTIKNKIPELSYAVTLNGVELPVLDIMHPYFVSCTDEMVIAGTLLHDVETIDAGMLAALKISTNIKPRLLGINGLKNIVENNKWKIGSTTEGNPRYLIFALKKNIT
jgi:hypothetical protein